MIALPSGFLLIHSALLRSPRPVSVRHYLRRMLPSWNALIVTALAIAPGYVAITMWSRQRTWLGPTTELRTLLQALSWSTVVHLTTAPIAWPLITLSLPVVLAEHRWRLLFWLLATMLLVPACLGVLVARLTDWVFVVGSDRLRGLRSALNDIVKPATPPTIWDWWLMERPPNGSFVRVTLRDGTLIGGVFSDGSKATTSPEKPGLFLASEWALNGEGDFVAEIPTSLGVLIPDANTVASIRVVGTLTEHVEEARV